MPSFRGIYEKVLKRHVENHMNEVFQLKDHGLKYQRPLKYNMVSIGIYIYKYEK